jgi:hypothetical protein
MTKEEFAKDVTEISDMPSFNKELVISRLKKWLVSIGAGTKIFITRERSEVAGHYLETKEGELILSNKGSLMNLSDDIVKEVYFEVKDKVILKLNEGS